MYENNFTYDANGNILAQGRKDATGTYIDTLTYQYAEVNGRKVQNRLYHVNDPYNYNTEDIDDMGTFNDDVATINDGITNNYQYDEIGNLIKDTQEEIEEIKWRVDGKIAEIKRGTGSNKQNLVFNYDVGGNRIAKHLYLYDTNNEYMWEKSTYYVRDAQGNPMAVYNLTASGSSGLSYKVAERNIYGSSRIGVNTTPVELIASVPTSNPYPHQLGDKQFELSNHLGNILATVSDKKLPVDDGNGNIAYFMPHVITAQDYSPFGVLLEDRKFGSELQRHLFNGMEQDAEVSGVGNSYTAEFWQYSPRLGRRFNVDPVIKPWMSSYHAFSNRPISNNDPNGACDDCPKEAADLNTATKEGKVADGEKFEDTNGNTMSFDKGLGAWLPQTTGVESNPETANVSNVDNPDTKIEPKGIEEVQNGGILSTTGNVVTSVGVAVNYSEAILDFASKVDPKKGTGTVNLAKEAAAGKFFAKGAAALKTAGKFVPVVSGVVSTAQFVTGQQDFGGVVYDAALIGVGFVPVIGVPVAVVGTIYKDEIREGIREVGTNTTAFQSSLCFIAGTKILMKDGSAKNIEEIIVGDTILTYNLETKHIEANPVLRVDNPMHIDLVEINFDNEVINTNTPDHPYYVKGKGWSSVAPTQTKQNYKLEVTQLEKGDTCLFYNEQTDSIVEVVITSISSIKKRTRTYNLSKVANNHNFFANGILVHNKLLLKELNIELENKEDKNGE